MLVLFSFVIFAVAMFAIFLVIAATLVPAMPRIFALLRDHFAAEQVRQPVRRAVVVRAAAA